ncbi:unnamed protein product [Rhizoctonia solani]|uniref:Uncharacterized protein n=1 Tax=Rhizoctonia solani TaxID=456999 RepID=A0A8H3DGK4_9AGAM|nr:unnamed protein product [Rhizoctonia solani]
MPFATSLDTWLIASAWLASNSFGFNMSDLGISSFWTIPLGYLMTLFHHGYLFRDLRRDPSVPIRGVYKFLFPCLVLPWIVGGIMSIHSAVFHYELFRIQGGIMSSDMIAIAQTIGGGMALIEAGLIVVICVKCTKFKANASLSKLTDDFEKAGDRD